MAIPVSIAKLDRARQLLAEVRTIDDAKNLADIAAAAELFARKQKLALDAQNDAAEIRIRAERKIGEFLREAELSKGGRPTKETGRVARPVIPTLSTLKLTKDQSARAQKLAKVPAPQFEARLKTARADTERLSTAVVLGASAKKASPSIQDRRTPRWFYDFLDERFGPFGLDAFAAPHNAMHKRFYTKEQNGLTKRWVDVTFGNPEFEDMAPIIRKALEEAELGHRSVILGPVGCSQEWFHQLAINGTVFKPDRRISYDLPDGTPTDGADRDTDVFVFGGAYTNGYASRGFFKVAQLELPPLSDQTAPQPAAPSRKGE